MQRSHLARWGGDLAKAILLAREAIQILGGLPDYKFALEKAMAHRLLAAHLEESSRPADAEVSLRNAIEYLEASKSKEEALEVACLALHSRVLVELGRASDASALTLTKPHQAKHGADLEYSAAKLALLFEHAVAQAEMLDLDKSGSSLKAAEQLVVSLPEDVGDRQHFRLEKAAILELKADLLDRSERQRKSAMNLFEEAATLRLGVISLGGENFQRVLGVVRNYVQAGTWLLDLAVAPDAELDRDTVTMLADKQFTAAEALLRSSESARDPVVEPEERRLELLLKCGQAESRLLQNQPLAALDLLDAVGSDSARLLRDLPQDLRHLELRSRALCLRALCFEQLNETQKAAESLREERQLMNERMPAASSAARTWLRAATRYARAGYTSQAAETLRKALGQISANHVAFPVFTETLDSMLPPE